jgi:hypothetical protein
MQEESVTRRGGVNLRLISGKLLILCGAMWARVLFSQVTPRPAWRPSPTWRNAWSGQGVGLRPGRIGRDREELPTTRQRDSGRDRGPCNRRLHRVDDRRRPRRVARPHLQPDKGRGMADRVGIPVAQDTRGRLHARAAIDTVPPPYEGHKPLRCGGCTVGVVGTRSRSTSHTWRWRHPGDGALRGD